MPMLMEAPAIYRWNLKTEFPTKGSRWVEVMSIAAMTGWRVQNIIRRFEEECPEERIFESRGEYSLPHEWAMKFIEESQRRQEATATTAA